MLQMDSADNYTCVSQDKVQSVHWNQNQVTLFTAVAWLKSEVISEVIVSDCLQHTKTAVVVFLHEVLGTFPSDIEEVHIWMDGPSSQFKNRYAMEAMKMLSQKHEVSICWKFSATSPGKGPVNGIGRCIKRIATTKVKLRQAVVNNAAEFFKAVQGSQINFTLITAEQVQVKDKSLELDEVFQ